MAYQLSIDQRRLVEIACGLYFTLVLALSVLLAYYAFRDIGNDGPNALTNLLSRIVERQSTVESIFTVLLSALPALFIAVSRLSRGTFTRFGVVSIILLGLILILSSFAGIGIKPQLDSPESEQVALSVVAVSKDIASFSLTYLLLLIGVQATAGDN